MTKVLYITGVRHCGSTMLEAILGAAPRVQSLGEVWGFFRYETTRIPCVCGEPAGACDLCQGVRKQLGRDDDARQLDLLNRRQNTKLSWLWRATPVRKTYAAAADDLFEAAARSTGSEAVIDSSKNVARLAALVAESRHDLYALHLVRDPRGSVKSEERNAALFGTVPNQRRALFDWVVKNTLMGNVAKRLPASHHMLLRYEDLLRDPHGNINAIGDMVGIDVSGLADAALGPGVKREHLYEPDRYADYRITRLDPRRIQDQRWTPEANAEFWRQGGFLSKFWGYDKDQTYLDAATASGARS